jgi:hypothetical protein
VKRRRHTPEQIVRKLCEADGLLAEGREIPAGHAATHASRNAGHHGADGTPATCRGRNQ